MQLRDVFQISGALAMTENLIYRNLTRAEISKFTQIDRSETIQRIYYVRNGDLVLEEEHHNVPDWGFAEKRNRIAELQEMYDKGATFFGAFDGHDLAGMAVLDHHFVHSGYKRLNLYGLWVSFNYRDGGIGRTLFQLAVKESWNRGAEALYISVTPSENTVRFYMNLGCRAAEPVDQYLFEKEPEDIHLELVLIRRMK